MQSSRTVKKLMILIVIFFFSLAFLASCDMISPDFYSLEIITDQRGYVVVEGVETETGEEIVKIESRDSFCLEKGAIVEIAAYPIEDYQFSRWEINGEKIWGQERYSLEMTGDKTVHAYFGHADSAEITAEISLKHSFPASPLDDFHTLELPPLETASLDVFSAESKKQQPEKEPEEIIVGFSRDVDFAEQIDSLESEGYQLIDSSREGNYVTVRLPEAAAENYEEQAKFFNKFKNRPEVRYVESNQSYQLLSITYPDDTYYSYQWNYPQIRLPQAWNSVTGSDDVRVAVLDTGVNSSHPDLYGRVDESDGYNVVADNNDYFDDIGHGSHVAGIIAAATDNNQGVAGVLWNSSIIPVKVMENRSGTWSNIAEGIYYASGLTEDPEISQPVDIINLSLGGLNESQAVKEAVQAAREKGVILVASAGNSGDSRLLYPAKYEGVISVGAVDYNYPEEPNLADYSNYSPDLNMLAPGGDKSVDSSNRGWNDSILSTFSDDIDSYGYEFMEGTSMSAPHICGVIGLMLANGIPRDDELILEILQKTSIKLEDIPEDIDIGEAGLVNAYWALHQPDRVNVVLKRKSAGYLQEYQSKETLLQGGTVSFSELPSGEYQLQAHLDVQSTETLDPGDYYFESDIFLIEADETAEIKLQLKETE